MGVTISKPAINIREALTEASAVVPYEQRQFHFDNLVTNGTFDADISGWSSANGATLSLASNALKIDTNVASAGAYQDVTTIVGQTYTVSADDVGGTRAFNFHINNTFTTIPNNGSASYTFAATSTSTRILITSGTFSTGVGYGLIDNVSVYEIDPSDNKTIHTMPKGWKPLHVYEDGALQREGSAYDYTVEYDGFNYIVKETVAPVAPYSTTVIGVRA